MRRSTETPTHSRESADSPTPRRGAPPARPAAPAQGGEEAVPTGSRFAPRNWRVVTKLYAIVVIPVAVALALGGVRVYDSYQDWDDAGAAQRTAELARAATSYAQALTNERDVSARPLLEGDTENPEIAEVRRTTDEARDAFYQAAARAPQTESLARRMAAVSQVEPQLEPLRRRAFTGELPGAQTEEGYVNLVRPLLTFANELNLSGENLVSYGRIVYTLSLAKSASSLQRVIGLHLLVAPGPSERYLREQLTEFSSYLYLENLAETEYRSSGTDDQNDRLIREMAAATEDRAAEDPDAPPLDEMVERIAAGGSPGQLAEAGITAGAFWAASTAEFDAYRTVEREMVDSAVNDAAHAASVARRDMVVNAAAVLLAVLLAFLAAWLMARTMSRDMRRLRAAAIEVADNRLPSVVESLSRTVPGKVDTTVAPIQAVGRDEIGQVARAFDRVHREAVRLAAEQAMLRGNVNAIFTNLSGRNQGLIERQLALITELENNESDGAQLEHLFTLDHLATRMRRNGENLLVLAGEEPKNRWNQPVPLVDVLRAAASEVEAYSRIELTGVPELQVKGPVVNDLVHLLAELLENATTFSSPQTPVRVAATRLPDGRIMIEIHDQGIGLTQEDFAEINKRLDEPPAVDATVSRRMGLFVVGRLAARHGIRVQLRPAGEQTGTTSLVMLPGIAVQSAGGSHRRPAQPAEERFTVSRIAPEEAQITAADREAGARTAAELGFDDSRYGAAAQTMELGTLGRSLSRARGQAALGPGPGAHRAERAHGEPAFDPSQGYTESPHGGPVDSGQRVGFDGPRGPEEQAAGHPSPGAGLPRRSTRKRQRPEEEPAQRLREESPASSTAGEVRWDRGPRREERSGGTTSAGLPRRVPRANLTEHSTPGPAGGGPQASRVSRDPKDVRGRLSSLRRGVEQGRGAQQGRGARNDEYEQER
ncbi:nitrate- and nitrite sensing domain-containing protein [Streptomyces hoynatensis]|uniref:sensor histidine kinase n=1 Tax=Streptomyces hoynatensis TaxID=1141874 RepID=UPI001F4DCAA8|nr:nitrate- and nitrite sensing domain-containing protein [Streptomyces hoynatensis]